jgi:hypothetical protein
MSRTGKQGRTLQLFLASRLSQHDETKAGARYNVGLSLAFATPNYSIVGAAIRTRTRGRWAEKMSQCGIVDAIVQAENIGRGIEVPRKTRLDGGYQRL